MPIDIKVRDTTGTGHDYEFLYEDADGKGRKLGELHFQNGIISEGGVNGTTNEAVLEVLLHRMGKLQELMPCRENALAITHMETALMWLQRRTQKRVEQGAEDSHEPHT